MRTRLAVDEDRGAFLAMARAAAAEGESLLEYDEEVTSARFHDALHTAHPTIFVAETDRLIGFAACTLDGFLFASGLMTTLQVIYVTPEKRGSRAAAYLVRAFLEWSDAVGARHKYLGTNLAARPEQTARLFARAGAVPVGQVMVIV